MNNNGLRENNIFNEEEILDMFIDLFYRKLDSHTQLRNSFDSINREVGEFLGIPKKIYIGQLLYIISDVEQIRKKFVEFIEHYYREVNKRVIRIVGVRLAYEIAENVDFLEDFDIVIIENIEEFYDIWDNIQEKFVKILSNYLDKGGKLLVTGCEFDNSNDALSNILYQGNLVNLTY